MTRVVLYETGRMAAAFEPVASTRPVYDLLLGARTLLEKAVAAFAPIEPAVIPRRMLADLESAKGRVLAASVIDDGDRVALLPANILITEAVVTAIRESREGTCFRSGGAAVGGVLSGARVRRMIGASGGDLTEDAVEEALACAGSADLDGVCLGAPWEIVDANPAEITREWGALAAALRPPGSPEVDPRAALIEPERIRVAQGARVDALAVLDAREGPILLLEGARVRPLSNIVGPAVIGAGSEVLGGRVGGGSSIGPRCRVHGEVDSSVIMGFCNKAHEGYLGHAVLGSWVNLGALTTNSDLKNNYGTVRVTRGEAEVDTGRLKVGIFLGDHVKTGVGSLLPSGCCVGAASNLFGGGVFAPRRVPPFTWWDGRVMMEHRFDAFRTTAGRAMGRRGARWDATTEAVFARLFADTSAERGAAGGSQEARRTHR
jgi:UDP-N-acetylglucosamine diphosphorylase/glucosamine-1-phosphate N-acetyltransferase